MENLAASFHTVLYMLLVMAIGRGIVSPNTEKNLVIAQINRMVFSVFLPLMIFQNIYTTDLETAFDARLLLYVLGTLLLVWLALMALTPKWIRDRRICGAFIQGSVRSNAVVFGMPIISGLFAGRDLGCPTILTAATTVCFNIIGVITLEIYRGSNPDPKKILRNFGKNPVVLASAAAILLVLFNIRLPDFALKTIGAMAGMASPMGLLLIGASLCLHMRENLGALLASVSLRLLVIPAIGLLGAAALGWRGMELCTVLIIMASPTSVSAYSMARIMDSDSEFTANQVGLSSVFAVGTIFFWTAVLELLHLL